jgi:hypothetical protein
MFRDGRIYTKRGNTQAAIRILKIQGPKAWATYNPDLDAKYLSGLSGANARVGKPKKGGSKTRTTTETTVLPPTSKTDTRAALLDALLTTKPGGNYLSALIGNVTSGAYTKSEPAQTVTRKNTVKLKGKKGDVHVETNASLKGADKDLKILESFYNGAGGKNTDNGNPEPIGFVSGHTDHVHYAAESHEEAVRIAKIAQKRYGLTVRELAPFDKVDPVHVSGSFHYKGLAADVSGDPAKMAAFSRWLSKVALRK